MAQSSTQCYESIPIWDGRKVLPMTHTDLVMSVPEAGRILRLSRNSAYEAARRGEIPTVRIGRLLRVPRTALEKMLEQASGPQRGTVG